MKIKIMDWKIPPESRKQGAIPIPDTSAEGTYLCNSNVKWPNPKKLL